MLAIRNYMHPQYGKRMKLTSRLIMHLSTYICLLLYIHNEWDNSKLAEDNYASNYFMHHN